MLPNTKETITWTSEYGEDIGRTNFDLLAVHALNGTPYIVASPNSCQSYNKWGRPNPPYVFFKYDGKAWQRIPLEEFPDEFQTINVALDILGREVKNLVSLGVVSSEKIKELNHHTTIPEFKTILREAVEDVGCPIPTTMTGKLIVPEVDGKPLYYNWWPLAPEWLKNTFGKDK